MAPRESILAASGPQRRSNQWLLIVGAISVKLLFILLLVGMLNGHSTPQSGVKEKRLETVSTADLSVLHALRELLSLDVLPEHPWKDSIHPCSWFGVTCSPSHSQIIELRLNGKYFATALPVDFSGMSSLRILDLSDCGFVGPLPKLPNSLAELYATGNTFQTCAGASQKSLIISTCKIGFQDGWNDFGCEYVWRTEYGVCYVKLRSQRETWRNELAGSMRPPPPPPDVAIPVPNPPSWTAPLPENPVAVYPASPGAPMTLFLGPESVSIPQEVPQAVSVPMYTHMPVSSAPESNTVPKTHSLEPIESSPPPTETPTSVPTAPSTIPSTPITIPSADSSVPVPLGTSPSVGFSCGPPPSVATGFVCDETSGKWVFKGDLIIEGIAIESPITIEGNFTTDTLVFSGESAFLTITGCANLKTIEIVLTQEQLQKIKEDPNERERILLAASNSAICQSLDSVAVKITAPKSCTKATGSTKTGTNDTGSKTLTALFKVDSTKCHLWWIILVSIIGALLLGVIIFVLLATFNQRVKKSVRPFWIRSQPRMTSV